MEQQIQPNNIPLKRKLRDDPTDWKLVAYFVICTIIFYGLAAPLAHFVAHHLGDVDTQQVTFDNIYYRYYVHTKYLPLQQLIYYSIMLITGFMFINISNLQNQRQNPLKGSDGTYKDFKCTIYVSILLFFASAIVVLRQNYDLKSYCDTTHRKPIKSPEMTDIDLQAPLQQIFMSIERLNHAQVLNTPNTPHCYVYTDTEVFNYNYFVWTTGFVLGLQFTHMDVGFLQQFTLDWNVMKNWPWYLWALFIGLISLIGFIFTYLYYLYSTIQFFNIYIGIFAGIIGLV
ncbi:UNKNOWN [Stylonychia lemnae]|uniref:Transmembrane protein n=1 Tax=Stylonychia lemnae TaxID=5949 RepID=A0A078AM44_STYLE|nr:UNKNOWN [Stylonychia lemnae]|eukprot:CDW82951.1 UNKNOWN [Stylonychia lemnae]